MDQQVELLPDTVKLLQASVGPLDDDLAADGRRVGFTRFPRPSGIYLILPNSPRRFGFSSSEAGAVRLSPSAVWEMIRCP